MLLKERHPSPPSTTTPEPEPETKCSAPQTPHPSYDVVLIKKLSANDLLLPKGHKNINESLEDAAIRETYEETGYRCKLLPLPVPTLAAPATPPTLPTSAVGDKETSKPRLENEMNTEPIACSLRPVRNGVQKIIFWFVDIVADDEVVQGTQMADESFENLVVPLERVGEVLRWEDDRRVVGEVVRLVKGEDVVQG